jgi:hypothetical protein
MQFSWSLRNPSRLPLADDATLPTFGRVFGHDQAKATGEG